MIGARDGPGRRTRKEDREAREGGKGRKVDIGGGRKERRTHLVVLGPRVLGRALLLSLSAIACHYSLRGALWSLMWRKRKGRESQT